ncbi:MAG: Crp/Fnr family transcriptional regulator [Gammaproteobacteria bacterium]|nr:Crp/Fnr family transcriptional regulator [Gammaproteobacteria bacterium]
MLKDIPFFSGLSESDLEIISSHATTKTFPKNSIIVNEGDETNSLYVILSGRVKIYLSDEEGKEIILGFASSGEHFGELALLDSEPRSASVMTLENSNLLIISKGDFIDCLTKNPEISIALINQLIHRIRALTENVKSLALNNVYRRIVSTLLHLAVKRADDLLVVQKITQQDLANMVGASREMVSRILKDLSAGGYITIERKTITINKTLPSGW